jgi:hypothetical protein
LFCSCIIHILNTGCAKILKKSGAKGLIVYGSSYMFRHYIAILRERA